MKIFIGAAVVTIVLSYSSYLFFPPKFVATLGEEDHFFEYLTAIFFFSAAFLFFLSFLRSRKIFYLIMALVFFFGCGEEISWGQRLLSFETPESMYNVNVQREFTIHNIEIFNAEDFDKKQKTGISKLLTINFQYKLFWLSYGVLFPLAAAVVPAISSFFRRCRLPLPPWSLGIFFLINWLIFRILLSFVLPPGETKQFYDTVGEIQECMTAFLFFLIGIHFLIAGGKGHTGVKG